MTETEAQQATPRTHATTNVFFTVLSLFAATEEPHATQYRSVPMDAQIGVTSGLVMNLMNASAS